MMNQLSIEINKLRQGNFQDYVSFYNLTCNYIYKLITDIIKDQATADQIMNSTYDSIYQNINTLADNSLFFRWAGQIATSECVKYINSTGTLDAEFYQWDSSYDYDDILQDKEAFVNENVLINMEIQRLIQETIDALPIVYKVILQYFYYEGMSIREISSRLNISEIEVRKSVGYIKEKLGAIINSVPADNNTKIYSLAQMPIFWIVFKQVIDYATLGMVSGITVGTGVAAAVAGQAAGGAMAGTGQMVAGGAMAGTGQAMVGGAAAETGVASLAGASQTIGGVAAGSATAGSAAAGSGMATGFLATVGGKIVAGIAATTLLAVGGVAVHHVVTKEDKKDNNITTEQVTEEVSEVATAPDAHSSEATDELVVEVVDGASYSSESETYVIPAIRVNGEDLGINQEIHDEIYAVMERNGAFDSGQYFSMSYEWGLKDNVVSVYVGMSWIDCASDRFVYNVDCKTGERLTVSEMCQLYGITEEEYYTKVKEGLAKYYDESVATDGLPVDTVENGKEKTYAEDNIKYAIPLIKPDGHLYAVGRCYTFAQAGVDYPHIKITDNPDLAASTPVEEELVIEVVDGFCEIKTGDIYSDTSIHCYHIPAVNVNGRALEINQDIYNELYGILEEDNIFVNKEGSLDKMVYHWAQKENVASMLVMTTNMHYNHTLYYTYNVNCATGEYMTIGDMCQLYGITEEEFYSKVKAKMEKYFDEREEELGEAAHLDEPFQTAREDSLSEDNIKTAMPYISPDGDLCAHVMHYWMAGSGYYPTLFNLTGDTEPTYPECNINHQEENSSSTSNDIKEFNGHYYQLIEVDKAWEEAVAYCQELGGYMATISSDEENEFLYEMLQESPYSDAYFGYTDVQEEGVWKWVNGEETTYTNWQDGEPNDENGIEEYAMFYHMTGNSRWNDGSFQGVNEVIICEWNSRDDIK